MGLDIRTPLGLIFLAIGAMLTAYGAVTHGDAALYARSLGIDMNLGWGIVMLVFGAIMFFAGRRRKSPKNPVSPQPWDGSAPHNNRH